MSTSGTYGLTSFDIGDLVDEGFERCNVDPATLKMRHLRSSRRSLNMLFAEWEARGDHLFQIDEQTQTLTDGTASYTPATGTLVILPGSAVIRRSSVDTPVTCISREMYHQIPNKTSEGLPSVLFHDRKANLYYLWNVPENSTDVLRYWRVRRIADVTAGQETMDVPKEWLNALAAGLAWQLAFKYAPDRIQVLGAEHERAYAVAKQSNRERADTAFTM